MCDHVVSDKTLLWKRFEINLDFVGEHNFLLRNKNIWIKIVADRFWRISLKVAVNCEVLQNIYGFVKCDSGVRTGRSHEKNVILSEELWIFASHIAIASESFEFSSDFSISWEFTSISLNHNIFDLRKKGQWILWQRKISKTPFITC